MTQSRSTGGKVKELNGPWWDSNPQVLTPMSPKSNALPLTNDNAPRGQWELGRVIDTYPGDDNCVRTVKVKTAKGEYVRPVSKVCILEENVTDSLES